MHADYYGYSEFIKPEIKWSPKHNFHTVPGKMANEAGV